MQIIHKILNSIPYLWILFNIYLLRESYLINGYNLFGGNQWKMLEYTKIPYPFYSTNIAHYDISEFLFYCIVPIYLYILGRRLISSILA